MAVASVMLPIGTSAPAFRLPDVTTGKTYSLESFSGKTALLIMFICKHCPYVQHIEEELSKLESDYMNTDLGIIAISSNDPSSYPDDAPEQLKAMVARLHWSFPLCFDETQGVAKAYHAACTPDFYLFDAERKLAYRGQLDDSRPGNRTPTDGRHLRAAIDALLSGKSPSKDQKASIGCGIKWKPGNAPPYA
ncbi:thioredoxin family protein [Nitrospira sp. KM1]|uniref:thioredoxin family protein n=1 Tax=Nitrospira sp. KM1 TaxID=1936990 RepID=UPI0013A7219D|nr:thioredoxin family protein [Nitrospira sp. KM1]BCA53196.1 thioredoxin family protein [Nitrospira sp. KM1]